MIKKRIWILLIVLVVIIGLIIGGVLVWLIDIKIILEKIFIVGDVIFIWIEGVIISDNVVLG